MIVKAPPPVKKKPPVRLRDVAKLVGVSTATVSRALALPDSVSETTRRTILEAVRKTGYIPNVAARNLRVRRTNMVLVVVSRIANTSLADVLSGLNEELSLHGYGLIIGQLDNHPEREAQFIRLAMSGAVDGILLLSLSRLPQDGQQTILDAGLPIIALNERLADASFPQVCVNNRGASIEVVRHLFGLGHRDIALISGPIGGYTSDERRAGFLAGLGEVGLDPAKAHIWHGRYRFHDGVAAARHYLRLKKRPTAVYAANDEMAIGFIKQMHESGIKVPEDVSVVGFDGVAYGDYSIPTLTTVQQPHREIGIRAAHSLIRQLHGEPVEFNQQIEAPLVIRQSTGPATSQPEIQPKI